MGGIYYQRFPKPPSLYITLLTVIPPPSAGWGTPWRRHRQLQLHPLHPLAVGQPRPPRHQHRHRQQQCPCGQLCRRRPRHPGGADAALPQPAGLLPGGGALLLQRLCHQQRWSEVAGLTDNGGRCLASRITDPDAGDTQPLSLSGTELSLCIHVGGVVLVTVLAYSIRREGTA